MKFLLSITRHFLQDLRVLFLDFTDLTTAKSWENMQIDLDELAFAKVCMLHGKQTVRTLK